MKNYLIFVLFLFFCSVSGQEKFYLLPSKILTQKNYSKFKDSLKAQGKPVEKIKHSFIRNDSLYVIPQIEVDSANYKFEYFDQKTYFQHQFKNQFNITKLKQIMENKEIYSSKPYFVNCWFTTCPPCRSEIPDLNSLKKEYGDRMNFVALTTDNEEVIQRFLTKHQFDFVQITNAKGILDQLGIIGFPTSFLLDKEGNFIDFVWYTNPVLQKFAKQKMDKLLESN